MSCGPSLTFLLKLHRFEDPTIEKNNCSGSVLIIGLRNFSQLYDDMKMRLVAIAMLLFEKQHVKMGRIHILSAGLYLLF